ncbi:DUF1129 domain-containing protein [Vagococcus vulneris]|uniref:DUF1129 domain-containing protein n=1 Tax=Vagococcus vulneris TaxID=1977869 RepID=UPI001403C220|nr:DUF1129 family protein [Vagococcus vulneris]
MADVSATTEDLRQKVADNRQLEKKLTKKNNQFIFDLKKDLAKTSLSEEQKTLALHDMLTALVEGQKSGTTAKQLYGTPTEAVKNIVEAPEALPEITFGKAWLDNSLVLFAFLAVITGGFSLLSNTGQATQGITSILIGAASGGLSFYLIYKYVYSYDYPGADQSKKPGALKSGGIIALCFIPWVLLFSASSLIPRTFNPTIDPMIAIVLGAAAYGIHFLLKKKFGIQGSLFMRRY